MVDHHVDRPGVEVQQCMQLTGTNSSIGLNALIKQCPFIWLAQAETSRDVRTTDQKICFSLFRLPGDYGGVAAPDPIPNSVVKRLSADGTLSKGTGE